MAGLEEGLLSSILSPDGTGLAVTSRSLQKSVRSNDRLYRYGDIKEDVSEGAGEVLGRDLTLVKMNAEDESAGAGAAVPGEGDKNAEGQGQGEGGEWDDAKQWEQGQGDELAGQMDADDAEGGIDKEERKRKKKERRLAEKKSKGKGAEA